MTLHTKPVTKSLPEYPKIEQLYNEAFPKEECSPHELLMRRTVWDTIDYWAIYSEEQWVGLVYNIRMQDLVYIFYLAIEPSARGKGYGTAILQMIRERYPDHRIFLAMEEVEPQYENYEQRIRRKAFYESNGFQMLNRKMIERDVIYDIAGTGGDVLPAEYEQMMDTYLGLYQFVLRTRFL